VPGSLDSSPTLKWPGSDVFPLAGREALAVAKAQSALALELRSTLTKARLLAEGGQRDQARYDLALVYGRFTEGLDTADLRTARELIENLA
jgi:predicted ATPase